MSFKSFKTVIVNVQINLSISLAHAHELRLSFTHNMKLFFRLAGFIPKNLLQNTTQTFVINSYLHNAGCIFGKMGMEIK